MGASGGLKQLREGPEVTQRLETCLAVIAAPGDVPGMSRQGEARLSYPRDSWLPGTRYRDGGRQVMRGREELSESISGNMCSDAV